MAYSVEYTDTFGGEANYCWVKRARVDGPNDAAVKRAAKAAMGLTGVRGTWDSYGDAFTFHPRGSCTVLFVQWDDSADAEA